MRHLSVHALALGAMLIAVAAPVHAQWKWRDANGSIQFSDRPPPVSVPERDILKRPNQAGAASTAGDIGSPTDRDDKSVSHGVRAAPNAKAGAAPPVDPELDRRRKAEEAEKAARAKADEERRKALQAENCARARSAVATYESGIRVARVNEKGEREFLDDRQRNDELKRAKEVVSTDCR